LLDLYFEENCKSVKIGGRENRGIKKLRDESCASL
jgi:hypothetical protein